MGILNCILVAIGSFLKSWFGGATTKGSFLYKLKYIFAHRFVLKYKKRQPPTFPFDKFSTDLGELGITSPKEAWTKECPRKLSDDVNAFDSIALWGGDSDGNLLITSLSRRHGRMAEVLVYLKLSNGDVYQLPAQPDLNIYNTNETAFSVAGLTFEIHEPLRRCRITFNGLLRKGLKNTWNNDYSNVINAKFTFTWHPFSLYYAFNDDFDVKMMASCLAQADWRTQSLETLISYPVEMHEHWGHIVGTLQLEGQEEIKMLLRGSKERKHGILDWNSVQEKVSFKGLAKDGKGIHLEVNNTSEHLKDVILGYITPPCNSKILPINDMDTSIKDILSSKLTENSLNITLSTGNLDFDVLIEPKKGFTVYGGENWECEISVIPVEFSINGRDGFGFIELGRPFLGKCPFPKRVSLPLIKEPENLALNDDHVVTLDSNGSCQSSKIVGGKGASLTLMTMMSKEQHKFIVPSGICLTKYAFEQHIMDNKTIEDAIKQVENVAWKKIEGNLEETCKSAVSTISEIKVSKTLQKNIEKHLSEIYGDKFKNMRFAIRSSAIGEDSEELSAAGQNDTFLGITGLKKICKAVRKCWASQFAFRSVEYKRRNGQLINDGMAVVIQEMVPAEVAGVLFTRHPLTGNLGSIVISANYGLGESVVSASADPDMITLNRTWDDALNIQEIQIGGKKNKVVMKDDGGTEELEIDEDGSSKCCISKKDALLLGEIAVLLEKSFGSARDIEWAYYDNKLYLLQSRPVTTINMITDYEIYHEFDTGLRTDHERFTTANIGEVMPGANTPLSITCDRRVHGICFIRDMPFSMHTRFDPTAMTMLAFFYNHIFFDRIAKSYLPPAPHTRYDPTLQGLAFFYNHVFFDRIAQKSWQTMQKPKSGSAKSFELGYYGRILDDDDVLDIALERYPKPGFMMKFLGSVFPLLSMWKGMKYLKTAPEKFENFPVHAANAKTASEAYNIIGERFLWVEHILVNHIKVTMGSSFWNFILLNILAGSEEDYSLDHYHDFAVLIGSCNGAESGDVPFNLKQLAIAISESIDTKKFISMTPDEALLWLTHTPTSAGKKYQEFLKRHGHRGMKEFEMRSPSWGMQPTGLVHILQKMLTQIQTIQKVDSTNLPLDETLKKLKTHLSFFRKKFLPFVLSWCKTGVCCREKAKAMLIKVEDCLRQSYHILAKLMVNEGYIPDMDFIFFMTHEEIGQILKTRSPGLLARVERRRRAHHYMENLQFNEMCDGPPKPKEELTNDISSESKIILKAYPVCQGYAKGTARVVVSFDNVNEIQEGDILITYATDIGWSPYFPMLGGVVTEIGGLVSHGAVCAREYGLPCVVAAENATRLFKSGDTVILDANKGILQKI